MSKVEEKLINLIGEVNDKFNNHLFLSISNENYVNELKVFSDHRDIKEKEIRDKIREIEHETFDRIYNLELESSKIQMELNAKKQELLEKYKDNKLK